MGNKNSSITKFRDEDISTSINKEFIQRIEKEDPEFWEFYKTNKFQFYWNACINPDSISIEDDIEWASYEREDNIFLEYWYQKFLKGEIHAPRLGDYVIDFHGMLQYHNTETDRQRAIVRELPEKVEKVKRNSRFDKNFQISNFKKTKVDQVEENFWKEKVQIGKKIAR